MTFLFFLALLDGTVLSAVTSKLTSSMSKTLENENGNWIDRLLNLWPFCIDMESIKSVGIAWLFKEDDCWCFLPRITGNDSLFYNAIVFVRLSLPFGVFVHLRWAKNWRRSFLQAGIGWKLNGRFSPLFRLQSDASAAEGVTGANYGQATGFDYGTH